VLASPSISSTPDYPLSVEIVLPEKVTADTLCRVLQTTYGFVAVSELRRNLPRWKRTTDVLISSMALLVLSPILVATSLAVRFSMGRPLLFLQVRTGLGGVPFTLFKFRTMRENEQNLGDDEARLTRLGKFLRHLSLDELPQLWNVLRGEMSIVGPRPLLVQYRSLYTPEQATRHDVNPGITGWSQVNGRNKISWEDRFLQDQWYVQNQSFWIDIKILFLTLQAIISRQGVTAESHDTMPMFTGTPKNAEQADFNKQCNKAA